MADSERKKLVWIIKKDLLALSPDELFQIATTLGPVQGLDESSFSSGDEEACFEYITSYMQCTPLLESEDRGMGYLLQLKDEVDLIIQRHRSGSQTHVPGDGVSSMSFANKHDGNNLTHVPISSVVDVEASDVDNANTGHLSATANGTEMQKILASYEELSQAIHSHTDTAAYSSFTSKITTHNKQRPSKRTFHTHDP